VAWRLGVAASVASALCCSYALLIVHVVLVPHAFSCRTGRVIHGEQAPPCEHEPAGAPLDGASEEDCQVFAVVQQASALPPPPPALALEPAAPLPDLRGSERDTVYEPRAIFLFAPSLSPPVRSR
jgi:hypothetical protein